MFDYCLKEKNSGFVLVQFTENEFYTILRNYYHVSADNIEKLLHTENIYNYDNDKIIVVNEH